MLPNCSFLYKYIKLYFLYKGIKMDCWEALYMNLIYNQGLLISDNKSQIITRYSTWQSSHVTYRLLPLTVVLKSSHQAHTPQGKSRSTLSIIIQISNFGTLPYNFDIPFHIRVQISRCQTPTTHTKISQVIPVKHVQQSMRMDHKGSETCRSF